MESGIKYYVFDGIATVDPQKKLVCKTRVVTIPNNFPFLPSNLTGYNSLKDLRKSDSKWKKLKTEKSKTADTICYERFIIDFKDVVLTPSNKKFNEYSFELLQHTIHGKYDKEFQGLHLLCDFNKNIKKVEELRPEDTNGVWEAKVTVYNELRDKSYEKVSTFFPKHWTPTHFMFETFHAIENIEINSEIKEYKSETQSGIPVIVIIENNRAKTIYPIYKDEKPAANSTFA
ncbi:MAG: EndoU domain-containing protein [Bacteroidia bacterium]|nr:EndoU domain-containing protein [Bacteroidia bacterium]